MDNFCSQFMLLFSLSFFKFVLENRDECVQEERENLFNLAFVLKQRKKYIMLVKRKLFEEDFTINKLFVVDKRCLKVRKKGYRSVHLKRDKCHSSKRKFSFLLLFAITQFEVCSFFYFSILASICIVDVECKKILKVIFYRTKCRIAQCVCDLFMNINQIRSNLKW